MKGKKNASPSQSNLFNELELPEGWTLTKIRDLVTINYGKGLKDADRAGGSVSVYGSNGIVGSHNKALTNGPSIIIGRKGSIGEVHYSANPSWPIDTTYYIDKFEGIDPSFVVFALKSLNLSDLDTSTAIPGLNRNDIYDQEIPLPSVSEQHRIVARVEALLTQVNATRDRLSRVPLIMKKFRQAVLAAACSGRLTEGWENSEHDWEIVQFDEILERNPQNGLYLPQSMYGSGYPIIRIDDYHNGILKSWSALKRVQLSQDTAEKYSLEEDDILINRVNSMKFLGKSLLIPKHNEITVFECNMIRFKVNKKLISPNFAILYLLSPQGLEELHKNVKHAVNQSSINQTDIRAIPFPLPPLAEQHEIVRRVGMLFEHADAIDQEVAAAGRRCERLTQAVLGKAFRGELVAPGTVEGQV